MTLTVEIAGMMIGTLVGLAGFAWGIVKWVLGQLHQRDMAIQAVANSLDAHKLYAAEHFATTSDLASALGKVEAAIDRVSVRLDQVLMMQKSGVG